MKKRIFLINAHRNGLLMKYFANLHLTTPVGTKYKLLLDALISNENFEIYNLVTDKGCSVPYGAKNILVSYLESKYVIYRNGYGKRIKTITNPMVIKDDDIVWTFAHVQYSSEILKMLKCRKFVMLNQFNFHEPGLIYDEIHNATDFIMEANVFKEGNVIYRYKLPDNFKFHLLPYTVADRFENKVNFEQRIKKAIATGTLATVGSKVHRLHYESSLCHKMRKVIYDNKNYLQNELDSMITPYVENKKIKAHKEGDSKLVKFYKTIYNTFIAKEGSQKSYFSINIVDKYNEYQMAIVPEEYVGVPAIGAFECMACGCAMIGLDSTMYTDLGLIPGVHYIVYDGTIDDLKKKINYYQSHQSELKQIAETGADFVNKNFRKEYITKRFLNILCNQNIE